MRIQIKTYTQKTIWVEIDDSKTVYELKRQLYMLPDVASPPELQRLIYAGQVLKNDMKLSTYEIQEDRPLVIMILQHMEKVMDARKAAADGEPGPSSGPPPFKKPLSNKTKYSLKSKHEKLVENIVNMGYPEPEVRRALRASFDNPERAIEYLVDGIPESPPLPEGNTSSTSTSTSTSTLSTSDSSEVSPFEFLKTDPVFRRLKRSIMANPQFLDTAIKRMGELNPAVLRYINENRQEFMTMLFEPSDDEDDDDDDDEAGKSEEDKKKEKKKKEK